MRSGTDAPTDNRRPVKSSKFEWQAAYLTWHERWTEIVGTFAGGTVRHATDRRRAAAC